MFCAVCADTGPKGRHKIVDIMMYNNENITGKSRESLDNLYGMRYHLHAAEREHSNSPSVDCIRMIKAEYL